MNWKRYTAKQRNRRRNRLPKLSVGWAVGDREVPELSVGWAVGDSHPQPREWAGCNSPLGPTCACASPAHFINSGGGSARQRIDHKAEAVIKIRFSFLDR